MKSLMYWLIGNGIGLSIIASIVLITYAGVWGVWGPLLGFIWPSGPEALIAPRFWVFVAYMVASIPINLLLSGVFQGIREAIDEHEKEQQ